ncbi:hypothetical protein IscW_ISCW005552 [Ixodes scapularis]|uniref:Uncharacterized protein n=1 Tax=Ixodes scapularis TaxID=6945 RepID=B7PNP5_IXOSC|nr:hypothetical protein IscW_ISCW005552 [Ixodes scapularis]|eukprot:XP_002435387.1 hypothetical protein IscW_ISCW005552 [Ixodes scapularis]
MQTVRTLPSAYRYDRVLEYSRVGKDSSRELAQMIEMVAIVCQRVSRPQRGCTMAKYLQATSFG